MPAGLDPRLLGGAARGCAGRHEGGGRARLPARQLGPQASTRVAAELDGAGAFAPLATAGHVARLVSRLQRFREDADYGEGFVADEAGARAELVAARAFVERVASDLAALDAGP